MAWTPEHPGTSKIGFLVQNHPYSEVLRTLGPDLGQNIWIFIFEFSRIFINGAMSKRGVHQLQIVGRATKTHIIFPNIFGLNARLAHSKPGALRTSGDPLKGSLTRSGPLENQGKPPISIPGIPQGAPRDLRAAASGHGARSPTPGSGARLRAPAPGPGPRAPAPGLGSPTPAGLRLWPGDNPLANRIRSPL